MVLMAMEFLGFQKGLTFSITGPAVKTVDLKPARRPAPARALVRQLL